MELKDIMLLENEVEIVEELKKGRDSEMLDIKEILKSLSVKGHKVFDESIRKDKLVKQDDGSSILEPVNRIGLAMQKLIVKRAVAFLFGNAVEYINNDNKNEEAFKVFKDVLKSVKINSFNRKIARDLFSCKEVAELWYPVPKKDGDKSDYSYKIKVKKLSILSGDKLYPYFDEYGDMVAFSREYSVGDETYFDVYTDDKIYKFNITEEAEMVEGYPLDNIIGKIPVIYARQEETAYEDVEELIDRLEKLLSNFADTNDYHASPKIFVKGTIKGFSKKGESGAIIEGDSTTDVKYLSWTHAPEAVKLEIETLKEMIHTISQTPDISFNSLKGVGGNAVSGKALKFMFLDAHLKVMDNMEVFDEYLQRRTSLLKAFISKVKTSIKATIETLDIEAEITPFMTDDYTDKLEFVMTATGNKPVLSQKTGVKLTGLIENADEEYKNIKDEESVSVFEPTGLE